MATDDDNEGKVVPHSQLTSIDAIANLLFHAVENHPNTVNALHLQSVLMSTARKNDRRPAKLEIAVPDSVVKNIAGKPNLQDVYLLVRVPRDVADAWANPSLIVRPGPLVGPHGERVV
jgi:hypothetical protein